MQTQERGEILRKENMAYVHDAAEEHGAESDIDVGPLLAKAVEEFKAHVGVR